MTKVLVFTTMMDSLVTKTTCIDSPKQMRFSEDINDNNDNDDIEETPSSCAYFAAKTFLALLPMTVQSLVTLEQFMRAKRSQPHDLELQKLRLAKDNYIPSSIPSNFELGGHAKVKDTQEFKDIAEACDYHLDYCKGCVKQEIVRANDPEINTKYSVPNTELLPWHSSLFIQLWTLTKTSPPSSVMSRQTLECAVKTCLL